MYSRYQADMIRHIVYTTHQTYTHGSVTARLCKARKMSYCCAQARTRIRLHPCARCSRTQGSYTVHFNKEPIFRCPYYKSGHPCAGVYVDTNDADSFRCSVNQLRAFSVSSTLTRHTSVNKPMWTSCINEQSHTQVNIEF
jgi:hypothetical protein